MKKTRHSALVPLLLLSLILTGCGTKESSYGPIRDLVELRQDAGVYHGLESDKRILSAEEQTAAWNRFLSAHFAPWEREAPIRSADEVFWGLSTYADKPLFGENTLPRSPDWLDRMAQASRTEDYPSLRKRAVAVVNTSMRVLPTHRPAFRNPNIAGEGFPFDYMQNSLVLAGTPLLATHTSENRAWVLVESRFASGWVRATDIAWVDAEYIAATRNDTQAVVTRDNVPVLDGHGQFCFIAQAGTILPMTGTTKSGRLTVSVPVRDDRGNAVLHTADLDATAASPAPVPATPGEFARVANAMLGRQYGWGGLYENRDCSAMTMDIMAVFGILLPRNSSQQIATGERVSLAGLSRSEKKRRIIERATPFLTLVRSPGHIMLYVGSRQGTPLVLHATWGVKTRTEKGYGRKVIGITAITTLEPGLELDTLARPGGVLLDKVRAITTLP